MCGEESYSVRPPLMSCAADTSDGVLDEARRDSGAEPEEAASSVAPPKPKPCTQASSDAAAHHRSRDDGVRPLHSGSSGEALPFHVCLVCGPQRGERPPSDILASGPLSGCATSFRPVSITATRAQLWWVVVWIWGDGAVHGSQAPAPPPARSGGLRQRVRRHRKWYGLGPVSSKHPATYQPSGQPGGGTHRLHH